MTYNEIIKDKKIEIQYTSGSDVFYKIYGKDVKNSQLKSVLFYGNNGWIGSKKQNQSFEWMFFYLVRKGKIEIPNDYDTCSKCGGTGNVGYNIDGGMCWKCSGIGYKKI